MIRLPYPKICLEAYEAIREKTYLLACAPNEDSNWPAHPCSLIRIFIVHTKKLCIIGYPKCAKSLRKHAYSNILKILQPKKWKFSDKNPDIFYISAQNIDCGYSLEPPRRGGSNEYPQSMILIRNKKNNVYPCKPQFYYMKVGFMGSKLYRHVFMM